MTTTVALIAALDTKADDAGYLADRLREHGVRVHLIDVGVLDKPLLQADSTREEVAAAAGMDLGALRRRHDRSAAVDAMGIGARRIVEDLVADQKIAGVFALGGGAGTTIGSTVMRDLPLGFPKAILSTVASGNTANYVGTSDIVMFPSIVDIAGLNRISTMTYTQAADAFAGMVNGLSTRPETSPLRDRPLVAASMFGVTTQAVMRAKRILESAGYEVVVFHATGAGGRAMERLISEGYFDAVLDLTTTEWSDEIVGGILSAGPTRLESAALHGVPQVVSLGATDMVNFGAPDTIPDGFSNRLLYHHNAENTLMRVTSDEARQIGAAIGSKLSLATGPCTLLIPLRGTSALDAEGEPFDRPEARQHLFDAVQSSLSGSAVTVIEIDHHINDEAFANSAARLLLDYLSHVPHTAQASTHV
ncbi:Tm-1-like ATP-binding domain-containing protein [Rhodococcus sp. JS3073]|uniref:Tm-1-like ATP-binding domain-containing protein n=1 Tax=Rhodococcus sp. JS3073 TaxID=3002901 RepID=UPI002285F644|nr:Tm-1-like ATP-binding domain-containing protein [Rhodococcus sp. JS3073]WAM19008.1 Tm-1-like ATP-binding domain-containing protein [Rhodococcus sp. JS3073]